MRRPLAVPAALAGALLSALAVACAPSPTVPPAGDVIGGVDVSVVRPDVAERLARFVPTRIEADLSTLEPKDREVLDKLIAAARRIGDVFLRQAWADNSAIRERLAAKAATDAALKPALAYFDLSAGPWDRIDGVPFIGTMPQPGGAGYYPPDLTKAEFETWLGTYPAEAGPLRGLFTVVRRDGEALRAVPYSKAYGEWLKPAADLLREAAALTSNETLKDFLGKRADAFLSDKYYTSDVAWMDLDSRIELTIGPYETYEDRLFGYKAAFEAFVTVKDPEASTRLDAYKSDLPEMEKNLPIPEEHKNLDRGTESPIGVVDVVFTAGDTRAGVQTIAYNLPNDERVREAKGSKKILLRNVMDAKFRAILQPIGAKVLAESQLQNLTAEAFFNETLFHELSHGLGPGLIKVGGRDTEVRLELKDTYAALEEAKADVMGVWNVLYMIGKGRFPETFRRDIAVTYLAGMFRAARFGIEEAHGRGVALQFNYLREKRAIVQEPGTGRFMADFKAFEPAVRDLVREICRIQATGDYAGSVRLLETYAVVPPEWRAALDGLAGIPVDIRPIYGAAGETE